eukprot:scaffold283318_cov15-Tisochrysis_lutea.AAC.1
MRRAATLGPRTLLLHDLDLEHVSAGQIVHDCSLRGIVRDTSYFIRFCCEKGASDGDAASALGRPGHRDGAMEICSCCTGWARANG